MPPRKRLQTTSSSAAVVTLGLHEHVEPFLHYLKSECGMAANTLAAYELDLRRFVAWNLEHGRLDAGQIDLARLVSYLDHLTGSGLAASSIARHLVTLKTFFRYLVLEGLLAESAAELVNSPKLWQRLPTVLSPAAVDRLLQAPGPDDSYPLRDRAILAVMYATGCRTSEVLGLTLDSLRLEEGYCRVLGKGNKERLVPLNPVARRTLVGYLDQERPMLARSETRALFVSRSGKPLTRVMIWMLIKRYAARAGCGSGASPHTLRHSFATHMLAGGAEIRALQELLGHASIRTTQIYTHVEHSRLKSVHQKCHPRG